MLSRISDAVSALVPFLTSCAVIGSDIVRGSDGIGLSSIKYVQIIRGFCHKKIISHTSLVRKLAVRVSAIAFIF